MRATHVVNSLANSDFIIDDLHTSYGISQKEIFDQTWARKPAIKNPSYAKVASLRNYSINVVYDTFSLKAMFVTKILIHVAHICIFNE